MDGLIPHLLTKLDQHHDLLRDIKEVQSDHSDILDRIETKSSRDETKHEFDWQRIAPTVIWAIVLLALLILQIPLKDAVLTVTKLSSGL